MLSVWCRKNYPSLHPHMHEDRVAGACPEEYRMTLYCQGSEGYA